MIYSYYEDIFYCLLEYFPDYVCLLIVQFIKSSLNEDSREEYKLDCNYFRLCKNLGASIPDLSKFMKEKYYHRYHSLQPNPLTNLYWKHIDVGPDHKDTLNQLHRCSLIDAKSNKYISHQIKPHVKEHYGLNLLSDHNAQLCIFIYLKFTKYPFKRSFIARSKIKHYHQYK